MGVRNAAMLGIPSVLGHSVRLLRLFLAASRITLLCVALIRCMCLWLLFMHGLLCVLLLSRLCMLRLLVRHGLSLMLLRLSIFLLLLGRPVFLLCRFSLLLLAVLFLAFFLACVRRNTGTEEDKQYCGRDWKFHCVTSFGCMPSVETSDLRVCPERHRDHTIRSTRDSMSHPLRR